MLLRRLERRLDLQVKPTADFAQLGRISQRVDYFSVIALPQLLSNTCGLAFDPFSVPAEVFEVNGHEAGGKS